MDIRNPDGVRRASLAATLASAVAASICCIAPLAATFLGLSGVGALVKYERYRSLFTALTLALLAGAFYLTYRRTPSPECAPGSACPEVPGRVQRVQRVVLWLTAVIAILVLTFPTWEGWLHE